MEKRSTNEDASYNVIAYCYKGGIRLRLRLITWKAPPSLETRYSFPKLCPPSRALLNNQLSFQLFPTSWPWQLTGCKLNTGSLAKARMDFLISRINNINRGRGGVFSPEYSPTLNSWRIIFPKEYPIRFINDSLTCACWLNRGKDKSERGKGRKRAREEDGRTIRMKCFHENGKREWRWEENLRGRARETKGRQFDFATQIKKAFFLVIGCPDGGSNEAWLRSP